MTGSSRRAASRGASPSSAEPIDLLQAADMALGVERQADLADQVELGLEEVDMTLLVLGQILEQPLGDAVIDRIAVLGGFEIECARLVLGGEVALDDLLHVLADPQRVEFLQVREAVEEQDRSPGRPVRPP